MTLKTQTKVFCSPFLLVARQRVTYVCFGSRRLQFLQSGMVCKRSKKTPENTSNRHNQIKINMEMRSCIYVNYPRATSEVSLLWLLTTMSQSYSTSLLFPPKAITLQEVQTIRPFLKMLVNSDPLVWRSF